MKKFLAVLLSVILIFGMSSAAFAYESGTAYYIDSVSGSDDNDGKSAETAWKTIGRASQNSYSEGDRILLKRGETFSGTFVASGSGSENNPITVSSYGEGAKPVIRGEDGGFIMVIFNVNGWCIENLGFTSPDGFGVLIAAVQNGNTENITFRNCDFYDISPDGTSTSNAAVSVNNDNSSSRIRNIHFDSLSFQNVAWAIHTNGINAETQRDAYVSPDESYNSDYLFENIYIKNAKCAGMVIAAVKNCTVRNCRVLDSATVQKEAYAPLWIRHSDGVTVEYCEIAGSTNPRDGMAIDFDGWTVNSTYRYIYSHDNNRFMRNCVFDAVTRNSGNEVCNCISVNDRRLNHSATSLISKSRPSFSRMRNFSFHDNIIVNGRPVIWSGTPKAEIKNISFSGSGFMCFIQKIFNIFRHADFKYNAVSEDEIDSLIYEITKNLPEEPDKTE